MSLYYKKILVFIKEKLKKFFLIPAGVYYFFANLHTLKKSNTRMDFGIIGYVPFLTDKYDSAGTVDRHYFLQDIYVAKKIIGDAPKKHYDIGSRLDGFCAHLLCNDIPLTMIDVRPLTIDIEGMTFIQSDATNLEDIDSESIHSLSSLHAIEHFGLGRYGDSIGAEKCFQALKAMQRVLTKGGKLYLSVPVSNRNGIIYNSHRVFKPATILKTLDKLTLTEFSYIQNYKIYSLQGEKAKQKILENSIALGDYDLGIFIMQKD